jgi:hypothetical protein
MSGSIDRSDSLHRYRAALPEATFTLCRLRASRAAIRQRMLERTAGKGPLLAGDALTGASGDVLEQAINDSMADDQALDCSGISDCCVDTTALTVDAAASAVRAVTGRNHT